MNKKYNVDYIKNISWVKLGSEVFVFNESTNEITLLRNIIAEIWVMVSKENNLNYIFDILNDKYKNSEFWNIDKIKIKLNELIEKQLIVVEETK